MIYIYIYLHSAKHEISGYITCDERGGCKFNSHQISSTNSEWKVTSSTSRYDTNSATKSQYFEYNQTQNQNQK